MATLGTPADASVLSYISQLHGFYLVAGGIGATACSMLIFRALSGRDLGWLGLATGWSIYACGAAGSILGVLQIGGLLQLL